ncbi:MAG: host attachment protein [Sulfurimonas sp.]|uniref:host attachment protein n=1 Tax=Sulfurimonas sp. TaxID=2022749 RepID=UPI0026208FC2|nr:host attachment protein [Sulfurimonas sp.]MDD2652386.1 host attachment protein [Sulfurimonas sp.]MDD3451138.1 host attachment protein [Sulfurimonas sp.]
MLKKLIVIADLQHFKLFEVKKDSLGRESLELLEDIDSLETHKRLSEKVSDQQGHFMSAGGSGAGEDHNLVLEWERRRIKEIGEQLAEALQKNSYDVWYFAAPKAINNQIVELIAENIKKDMKINLHADLTKIPTNKLLEHFEK